MKKFLFILMSIMMLSFVNVVDCSAQTYTYRTTGFSYKYKTSYGWTDWYPWESSNMKLIINYDDDLVIIYSRQMQVYHIYEYVSNYTDESGGKQIKFNFIDQDYDKGTMRMRIERNGNSQLYIDFADVMWVYNVVRI